MSFHQTSATLRMTCSDGVLRVWVKAIKIQPSVKLARVAYDLKTILLSNVTQRPLATPMLRGKYDGRSHQRRMLSTSLSLLIYFSQLYVSLQTKALAKRSVEDCCLINDLFK